MLSYMSRKSIRKLILIKIGTICFRSMVLIRVHLGALELAAKIHPNQHLEIANKRKPIIHKQKKERIN